MVTKKKKKKREEFFILGGSVGGPGRVGEIGIKYASRKRLLKVDKLT